MTMLLSDFGAGAVALAVASIAHATEDYARMGAAVGTAGVFFLGANFSEGGCAKH